MSTRLLLIVTAVLESATGIVLLVAPSRAAEMLLGTLLGSPAATAVARVAGAALLSIGVTCWRARNALGACSGLVVGLSVYNVAVFAVLVAAAVVDGVFGVLLWPACVLHASLAAWCVACLRFGQRPDNAKC